jgi:hypothetical protein
MRRRWPCSTGAPEMPPTTMPLFRYKIFFFYVFRQYAFLMFFVEQFVASLSDPNWFQRGWIQNFRSMRIWIQIKDLMTQNRKKCTAVN